MPDIDRFTYTHKQRRSWASSTYSEMDVRNADGEIVGSIRLNHLKAYKRKFAGRKGSMPDHFWPDQIVLERAFDIVKPKKYVSAPTKTFEPYINKALEASKAARLKRKQEAEQQVDEQDTMEDESGIVRRARPLQRTKSPLEQMRETYPDMDDSDLQEMLSDDVAQGTGRDTNT